MSEVKITSLQNGPNLIDGDVHLIGADGKEIDHKSPFALCRCGASSNKPFCDGSHRKIGFEAPGIDPAKTK